MKFLSWCSVSCRLGIWSLASTTSLTSVESGLLTMISAWAGILVKNTPLGHAVEHTKPPWRPGGTSLVDVIISDQGQEFREIRIGHHLLIDLGGLGHAGAGQAIFLFGDHAADQLRGDLPSIAESGAVAQPLPDLGSADFGGGGVLHQVVDGNATGTAQPRFEVLQADVDVPAEAVFGDVAFGDGKKVRGGDVRWFAALVDLD